MKKKIALVLIFVLLLGGSGIVGYWYFFGSKNKTDEITVGKNQSLIVAQINSINGNEITYAIAEEIASPEMGNDPKGTASIKEEKDAQSSINNKNVSGNENFGGRQNMPEGEMPSDMGEHNMSNGNMTEDMGEHNMSNEDMPGNIEEHNRSGGDMAEGMENGKRSARNDNVEDGNNEKETRNLNKEQENAQRNKTIYTLTGEEKITLIPVGTKVTTQLGTTTTFARLAAGDMVKMLMEKDEDGKDVIVGIWIIG